MKNTLIFVAVAFCLIMAIGYTPSEYYKQRECAKVNQSEIAALGDAIIAGQIPPETIKQKRKEYQAQRDFAATCSDLTAQWTVANLTWRGFMLGVIGMGLLGWTLIETRNAAKSASDTLDVADKTLAETVNFNRRGQRAYLAYDKVFIQKYQIGSPIEIRAEIRNFGATPATHYAGVCKFSINPEKGIGLEVPDRKEQPFTIIAPSCVRRPVYTSDFILDIDTYEKIKSDEVRIIFAAIFEYADAFDNIYQYYLLGEIDPLNTSVNASICFNKEYEEQAS